MANERRGRDGPGLYQEMRDAAGKSAILLAFSQTRGNRERAAEILGLTRRTFYREIGRMGLWEALETRAAEEGWPAPPGEPFRREA